MHVALKLRCEMDAQTDGESVISAASRLLISDEVVLFFLCRGILQGSHGVSGHTFCTVYYGATLML